MNQEKNFNMWWNRMLSSKTEDIKENLEKLKR